MLMIRSKASSCWKWVIDEKQHVTRLISVFADRGPRSVWSVCLVCGVDDSTPLITPAPILLSSQGISEGLRASVRDGKKEERAEETDRWTDEMKGGKRSLGEKKMKNWTERLTVKKKSRWLWMSDWVTDEWTGIMNVRRKTKDDEATVF